MNLFQVFISMEGDEGQKGVTEEVDKCPGNTKMRLEQWVFKNVWFELLFLETESLSVVLAS